MTTTPELTADQKDIIRYSLGLNYTKKAYLNHYCAEVSNAVELERLVELGMVTRGGTINRGNYRYYFVTEAGASAVGSKLPKD